MFQFVTEFASESEQSDGKYLKEALLFETGVHRGQEFTVEDLEVLRDSFDNPVPVQLDHSSSTKDTVGFLRKVWVDGTKLLGQLEIIDENTQERIEKGLSKKLSVGIYSNKKTKRPTSLREVSLVAFPQVKGATIFEESDEGGAVMDEKEILELRESVRQYEERLREFEEKEKELLQMKEQKLKDDAEKFVSQFGEKVLPAQSELLQKLVIGFSEDQLDLFKQYMELSEKVELTKEFSKTELTEYSEKEKAEAEHLAWKQEMGFK